MTKYKWRCMSKVTFCNCLTRFTVRFTYMSTSGLYVEGLPGFILLQLNAKKCMFIFAIISFCDNSYHSKQKIVQLCESLKIPHKKYRKLIWIYMTKWYDTINCFEGFTNYVQIRYRLPPGYHSKAKKNWYWVIPPIFGKCTPSFKV